MPKGTYESLNNKKTQSEKEINPRTNEIKQKKRKNLNK
jgi:hypothetical protein